MARKNTGMPMGPMPAKASFVYGTSGEREKQATQKVKGGDLRAKPGKNNGK